MTAAAKASPASDATQPTIIGEWDRNAREVIRVEISQYMGHPTISIRVWYRDGTGGLKPSKSGLTLGLHHLPTLADALQKAVLHARARGSLPDDGGRS